MTDFRQLAEAYFRQRVEMGEGVVFARDRLSEEPEAGAAPGTGVEDENLHLAQDEPKRGSEMPAPWMEDAPEIPGPGISISHIDISDRLNASYEELDLDGVIARIADCTVCELCHGRTNTVPGVGNPKADFMVVGEGPGQNEDLQGEPFVGRAGKLLDDILRAIGLDRSSIYIANIVKCRPPGNRNPKPEEIGACIPFLYRQIELVGPKVILAVGSVAAGTLLGTKKSLGQMRNHVHEFRGIPLVVTYHPAALLRNPNWKRPTWDDVRIARRILDSRS